MEKISQTSIKRHKISDEEQNMSSIDRFSGLPDGVICHILSFLPTKFSVATGILSRRWRFLWTHVPYLHFETKDFKCEKHHDTEKSFSDIVNRVMLLLKVQIINTFRLYCMYDDDEFKKWITTAESRSFCSEYQLETWINAAKSRSVQNIDIYFDCEIIEINLSRCLFTCKTLVDLKLSFCIGIPSNGAIFLPSLKKLHLYLVEYKVDEALPHLLSGCPVLDELIIDGIMDRNLGCFNISSPTIKRLSVYFSFGGSEFDNPDYRVKINAPELRYFQVHDCSYQHISLSPLSSLIEADIRLNDFEEEDYYYTCCLLKFLDSLCNVKCLKLSGVCNMDKVDVDEKNWMEPKEERRACLLYSLKTVTIDGFGCTKQDFNMVRFILRNAQVLKRMEIHRIGVEEKIDVVQKISLFHRGSRECELAFC
ncbi:hypothetical protein DH2020_031698 [Rehmannia glutinosa]|uniref:Uncharacterized protein n=1 Tax=Rehmannia glutinosa TaxID=99300 RepID=A0ABR0VHE2_REHGL